MTRQQINTSKRGKAHARGVHVIEGQRLTYQEIASRLGMTAEQARDRLRRERAKPGPVTWAGLGRGKG